jgi:manganese/zinc/iron transport system permease protein
MRKMAMLSDAISHTVLLGIVVAYFISQTLTGVWMIVGAICAGLLTTFLVQILHQLRVKSDAAIGITFTTMFALAILLISLFADRIHLDLDHVLYGELAFAPLDSVALGSIGVIPRAVLILSVLLSVITLIYFLLRKEIKAVSFDITHAMAIGIPTVAIHYLLMTLISVTTVVSFDFVGSILVVAMLVIPPASAYLIVRSFRSMLMVACLLAILSAIGGYAFAIWFDTSIAASMAVFAGIIFLTIMIHSSIFSAIRRK